MTNVKKKELRNAIRQAGKEAVMYGQKKLSNEFISTIERSPVFARARIIALFASLPDEVCTDALLRRWFETKKLALPSVEHRAMIFREYLGPNDLSKGEYGIMTPCTGRIVAPEDIDLMIVPGMAFDSRGNRLGRGKGFYDRYLGMPGAASIYKMGICLPHQLVDEVPCDPNDVAMDEVICANQT